MIRGLCDDRPGDDPSPAPPAWLRQQTSPAPPASRHLLARAPQVQGFHRLALLLSLLQRLWTKGKILQSRSWRRSDASPSLVQRNQNQMTRGRCPRLLDLRRTKCAFKSQQRRRASSLPARLSPPRLLRCRNEKRDRGLRYQNFRLAHPKARRILKNRGLRQPFALFGPRRLAGPRAAPLPFGTRSGSQRIPRTSKARGRDSTSLLATSRRRMTGYDATLYPSNPN